MVKYVIEKLFNIFYMERRGKDIFSTSKGIQPIGVVPQEDGDNKTFVCGYREKLSAFNKRRDSEKSALNKKDVNKFLNQQNKEDEGTGNSAMAEAFAKFNLK